MVKTKLSYWLDRIPRSQTLLLGSLVVIVSLAAGMGVGYSNA